MMKHLLCGAALGLMVASAATAQTSSGSPSATPGTTNRSVTTPSTAPSSTTQAVKASHLIGLDIKNAQNERIGEIEDVLVNTDGRVQQVIVSVGGFLGMGNKEVAISWDQLRIDSNAQTASVNMTKDQLKSAPEYKATRNTLDRERTGTNRMGTPPDTTRSRSTGGTGTTTSPSPSGSGTGTGTTGSGTSGSGTTQ